jgi:hypothetical protein
MFRRIKSILLGAEAMVLGVVAFFQRQWEQYTAVGQMLFVLALGALVVDAAISYQYGISMTTLHGYGFALLAIAFCVLPDIAALEFEKGSPKSGGWLAVACIPLGLVAYQSHIGYSAGVRLGDMQEAAFRHVKADNATASLTDERTNVKMWREQLADLKKRNADHAASNKGWLITVDPIAMQSQLAAMDTRIENEAKRVRCAQKCEELKTQRGQLAAMISAIKQENDLTSRIEATQRLIDSKTVAVAATPPGTSLVVNQNDTFAKLWNVATGVTASDAINPTAVQRDFVNTALSGTSSLAFMILAPLLMFAAGRNRKPGYLGFQDMTTEPPKAAPVAPLQPVAPTAPTVPKQDFIIQRVGGMIHTRSDVNPNMIIAQRVQAAA